MLIQSKAAPSKYVAVDSVAITNQKPGRSVLGECLDDLLASPSSGRMGYNVEMDDVPAVGTHYNKGEEYAERGYRDAEEVDSDE